MTFEKGFIPWNKGTHIQPNNALKAYYRNGGKPWNKGKKLPQWSGENHPLFGVRKFGKNNPAWKGGLPSCIDCGLTLSYYKGIRCSKCNRKYMSEENSPSWKGGLSKDRKYLNEYQKKRYYLKPDKKLDNQKRCALKRAGGTLPIKRIQMIYEDNIKKYGTLTCYLCLNPIDFRQDCLEHKTPLSRGGTNEYDNLGVAHRSCNNKKRSKTKKEYQELNIKKGASL